VVKAEYLVMAALALVVSACGLIPAGDPQGITPNEAYDNIAKAQTAWATCGQQVGAEDAVTCDGYKRLYDRDKQI
jgi:hypothetical protein